MPADIHEGDIGTVFRGTITDQDAAIVDVSGATTQEMIFEKPDGSFITKTTVFMTNGTDGIIQYTTIAADLDLFGPWRVQTHVILPSGEWKSDIQSFTVVRNLEIYTP